MLCSTTLTWILAKSVSKYQLVSFPTLEELLSRDGKAKVETGGTILVLCNTFEWERQYPAWAFRSNVAWLVPEHHRLIEEGKKLKLLQCHQETFKTRSLERPSEA